MSRILICKHKSLYVCSTTCLYSLENNRLTPDNHIYCCFIAKICLKRNFFFFFFFRKNLLYFQERVNFQSYAIKNSKQTKIMELFAWLFSEFFYENFPFVHFVLFFFFEMSLNLSRSCLLLSIGNHQKLVIPRESY